MKVKEAFLGMRYSGLWNIKFDSMGEQVFSFLKHRADYEGGKIDVQSFDPTK